MSYTSTPKLVTTVLILLCSGMLTIYGCSSKPTKFYVLTPLAEVQTIPDRLNEDTLSIGVGPISLPDYVNRPQIVTKNGANELVIDEFYRWAEPLRTNVSRVLRDNLATLLGTENINKYPWNRFVHIDYQVSIDFTRFDSVIGKEATIEARWIVLTDRGRNEILRKKSKITKKAETEHYDAIVIAESQALAELSQQIAHEIHTLSNLQGVAQVQ
ncbi:MAG: PqiC family protein [Nitrosomonadaceae bacterium]